MIKIILQTLKKIPIKSQQIFKIPIRNYSWKETIIKYDNLISKFSQKLGHLSFRKIVVAINIGFFVFYLFVPENLRYKFTQNPLLANFANTGLFSCLINSAIINFLARYIAETHGSPALIKIVIFSVLISTVLSSLVKLKDGDFNYTGNSALIQSLFFSIVLKDPTAKLIILPLPFPIRCFTVAIPLMIYDVLTYNTQGISGLTTGLLFVKQLI